MKVENMTYNAKTAFTERREIIDKLNECINSINTYGSEKIKDLETKNVQQDSDINNLKNADKDNVKINKINEYAVGLTGNQFVSGEKFFINNIIRKIGIPGGSSPENYDGNLYEFYIMGNDNNPVIGLGHEKSNTSDTTRLIFSIFANTNIETNRQPYVQIHFIFNEENSSFSMQPAHIDKNGVRIFGAEQVLMTW